MTPPSSARPPAAMDLDLGSVPVLPVAEHERTMEISLPVSAPTAPTAPQAFSDTSFQTTEPLPTARLATPPEPEMDFQLDLPASAPSLPAGVSGTDFDKTEVLDPAFGGLSLDLDSGTMTVTQPGEAGTAPSTNGKWQDMATKLDLAVAYRDIGDKDGARELLEEVMKEGDAAQVSRAKELMSALA